MKWALTWHYSCQTLKMFSIRSAIWLGMILLCFKMCYPFLEGGIISFAVVCNNVSKNGWQDWWSKTISHSLHQLSVHSVSKLLVSHFLSNLLQLSSRFISLVSCPCLPRWIKVEATVSAADVADMGGNGTLVVEEIRSWLIALIHLRDRPVQSQTLCSFVDNYKFLKKKNSKRKLQIKKHFWL